MSGKRLLLITVLSLCLFILYPLAIVAQEAPPQGLATAEAEPVRGDSAPDALSTTRHSLNAGNSRIDYTATTGTLRLKDEEGKPKADIFFVAYTVPGQEEPRRRPITFLFNGGPGASSIWLHLGAAGPRRVPVADVGEAVPPPAQVVENNYSWLPFTDLVFIDPVGSGYSRAVPGESSKQFWGIQEDIRSVGEFIRLYVTRFGRWSSPLFLAGESYGSFRAAGIAEHLYENFGMQVNGLLLLSLAIDFRAFSFDLGNDLPYVAHLPAYTASAWYHNKLSADLQESLPKTLREAENWVTTDYAHALAKGDSLPKEERNRIEESLERYTGLPRSVISSRNLRIHRRVFLSELLRAKGRSLDIMDGRVTSLGSQDGFLDYPTIVRTAAPYTSVLNDYVRKELKYETNTPYIFLSDEANRNWNWGSAIGGYVSALGMLRNAVTRSETLKIFAANGIYDLNTPYLGVKYTLDHLGLPPTLRDNLKVQFYEAGHMFYTHEESLAKFTSDVAAFYGWAVR
jgi:carboxypeptidase C (cathepsin A)